MVRASPVKATTHAARRSASAIHSGSTIVGVEPGGSSPLAPTGPMKQEATIAGTYHSEVSGRDYPRVQILTIRELLEEHRKPELPLLLLPACQKAERVEEEKATEQQEMFGS